MTIRIVNIYIQDYNDLVNFVSGFIWIPFFFLFLYLFFEHHSRRKFPQNLILGLLTTNIFLRCIWFFFCIDYKGEDGVRLVNRLAILVQFTAISVLMLMWMRALQITRLSYAMLRTKAQGNSAEKTDLRVLQHSLDNKDIHAAAEKEQKLKIRFIVIVNIVTWLFVILSTLVVGRDYLWYDINIIALSTLCLCEAVVTLVIGLRTSMALQRELAPVFVNSAAGGNANSKIGVPGSSKVGNSYYESVVSLFQSSCNFCGCYDLFSLYQLFFSKAESVLGLQLQRDVLRTLLNVTLICFVFFVIRSFGFAYHPLADE